MFRWIACIALLLLKAISAFAQAPRPDGWTILGPGGGGTTIAPTVSPHNPHVVVEHSDMTGGYLTRDDGLSWRMINLRGGIQTFTFDPLRPRVLYAGNAAVWRSEDAGQSWKMIFPDPNKGTVEHQLTDHSDYILSSGDRAYPGGLVSRIMVAPHDSRTIYAAFTEGDGTAVLTLSQDRGATWRQLAHLQRPITQLSSTLAGPPSTRGEALAISGSDVFSISATGAMSQLGSVPDNLVAAGIAHRGETFWIYATNQAGRVLQSQDAGRRWRNITPALGQTSGRFEAIATSERHPESAYVGFRNLQLGTGAVHRYNGIAKTGDGGQSWKIVFKESTRAAANLAGTWIEGRATQDGASIYFEPPYSLGVSPADPKIAYATDLFRSYRTLDGGISWTEVNSRQVDRTGWTTRGLDVTTDYGVQFDPFDPKHIFVDYTDIGLFQSTDSGRSWHSSSEGVPEQWRNTAYWLAFDPLVRGRIWGAFSGVHDLPRTKMWRTRSPSTYAGGVAVSEDGGEHWRPSSEGLPQGAVTHVLLDPASAPGKRTLYATVFGRGVYKSVDNGATWAEKNQGLTGKEPFAWRLIRGASGELYLIVSRRAEKQDPDPSERGAIYRSTDGAEHWERLPLPAGTDGPTGLAIDPHNPQRLYLTAWGSAGLSSDTGGGIFLSTDGGRTWAALFTASQHVYDVTIDPRRPDTLYICGFDAAAYRSLDRGAHWARVPGYSFKWGHRVIPDPANPEMIYITTYGGSVWHGPAGSRRASEEISTEVPVAHP